MSQQFGYMGGSVYVRHLLLHSLIDRCHLLLHSLIDRCHLLLHSLIDRCHLLLHSLIDICHLLLHSLIDRCHLLLRSLIDRCHLLNSRCRLIDFHAPTSVDGTHPRLFEWVRDYFHAGTTPFKPPLYLQHQGRPST